MNNLFGSHSRTMLSSRPDAVKPYHHGNLRESLLVAARNILETQGLSALSLRAAARAAGVSHAAPKNHFGDMTGLLSELAALGLREFGVALDRVAAVDAGTARDRVQNMAKAYVGFARAHPAMFALIFRSEHLDMAMPSLRDAYQAARFVFSKAMAQALGVNPEDIGLTPGVNMVNWHAEPGTPMGDAFIGSWSMVHGFAMLLIDHRLDPALAIAPNADQAWEYLLASAMRALALQGKP